MSIDATEKILTQEEVIMAKLSGEKINVIIHGEIILTQDSFIFECGVLHFSANQIRNYIQNHTYEITPEEYLDFLELGYHLPF